MAPRRPTDLDRAVDDAAAARSGTGRADPAAFGLPARPACPFCGGEETELYAPFGSALSVATYWCLRCRTAFERFKWQAGG